MAFPVVEQVVESATTTAGANHVITLPTATAGQLLLILLDKGSTSATINAHASLTELLDEASANGLYIAYRWMDGTEPSTYTLVSSANTRDATLAYRISGALNPAAQAPQIGTTGSGTSATPDPPASASPASTKDYLFIAFAGMAGEEADDDTWGNTPPTNYTPSPPRQKSCGVAGTNLGGLILAAERALNTGSAENPGTFGVDVSAAWRSQTIMVHPANPQTATPGVASLSLSTFAPTVTATTNKTVTPTTASLTLATFAPTVTAEAGGITATPDVASLTLSTFVPTVTTSDHKTVIPTTKALALTAFAPDAVVSDHITVTPTTAALTLSTFAPEIGGTVEVVPEPAGLVLMTFEPVVSAGQTGGHHAVGLTRLVQARPVQSRTIVAPVLVMPSGATLELITYPPSISITDDDENFLLTLLFDEPALIGVH